PLFAALVLEARDVIAQLTVNGADSGRADRYDFGLHRFADAGQVGPRESELVGAGAQRRLDLVARLVRGARRLDMAFELAHVAADRVELRPAPARGVPRARPPA